MSAAGVYVRAPRPTLRVFRCSCSPCSSTCVETWIYAARIRTPCCSSELNRILTFSSHRYANLHTQAQMCIGPGQIKALKAGVGSAGVSAQQVSGWHGRPGLVFYSKAVCPSVSHPGVQMQALQHGDRKAGKRDRVGSQRPQTSFRTWSNWRTVSASCTRARKACSTSACATTTGNTSSSCLARCSQHRW